MSLGLMMNNNWDRISMTSPQLQAYKNERPVYSTPHPVQSTPANNECKLVELRGVNIASFMIGGEEFICLPQVFDRFLKHLVGGLHTVYTKLKRLNIAPVVCNVEQVRVLRGLGAIQPGVNRCKLITRKDFETLYQDCTTASRPGRPPKRYPILPPTELMNHHPGARSINPARGIMGAADLSNFHKRMRLDHEANFHQPTQPERRMSTSPTRRSPPTPRKYSSGPGADDLYTNANIYIQQAIRNHYHQIIANGIHNGLNLQHTQMNAALAPLIGMSNPALFNGAIPPNILSQFNEMARNPSNEEAASSGTNSGADRDQSSPIQNKDDMDHSGGSPYRSGGNRNSPSYEESKLHPFHKPKIVDRESSNERRQSRSDVDRHLDMCKREESPRSIGSPMERRSIGNISVSSFHSHKMPSDADRDNDRRQSYPGDDIDVFDSQHINGQEFNKTKEESDALPDSPVENGSDWRPEHSENPINGAASISSMQTLLNNIQGLLKVAADNAKLQDKQLSFEIAELKNRITKEQEMRAEVQRKLEESERIRASIQRKLTREREAIKHLQEQNLNAQDKWQRGNVKSPMNDNDRTSSVDEQHSPVAQRELSPVLAGRHFTSDNTNAANIQASTAITPTEFSPMSSSPSVVSPGSTGECSATYWNSSRSLVAEHTNTAADITNNSNRTPSPNQPSSPINMSTTGERNWMPHALVQSTPCAK
ncbi:uncharacterized protein LOC120341449 [Styela clava]